MIRRVRIKKNAQKLLVPEGSKLTSAGPDPELPGVAQIIIELPISFDPDNPDALRNEVKRVKTCTAMSPRDKQRVLGTMRAPRTGETVYIVEQLPRTNSMDWDPQEIESPGLRIIKLSARCEVNTQCPLRIKNGRPWLCVRQDGRHRDTPYVYIVARFDDEEAPRLIGDARALVNTGRAEELDASAAGYVLFVDTRMIVKRDGSVRK